MLVVALGLLIVLPIYFALRYRNAYWKLSLLVLALIIPVVAYFTHAAATCTGEFCGLGMFLSGIIAVAVIGGMSIALAVIKKKNGRALLLVLLSPFLVVASLGSWQYYQNHRTGFLNPYTKECKREGFDGAKGNSCYCANTKPSSACCQSPGANCAALDKSSK